MNSNKQMIFLDIDGTLLNSSFKINPELKKVIKQLIKLGHHVCLATGRFIGGAIQYAEELGLIDYIITVNGNFVYDIKNKKTYSLATPLLPAVVNMFYDKAKQIKRQLIAYNIEQESRRYYFGIDQKRDIKDPEYFKNGVYVEEFDQLSGIKFFLYDPQKPIIHMSIKAERELLDKHFHELYNLHLTEMAQVSIVSKVYLDADNLNANKWNGVKFVAEKLNLPLTNTIVFGDSQNDFKMLTSARLGFCLANAEDGFKARLKPEQIIGTNDTEAIADKLKEIFADELKTLEE